MTIFKVTLVVDTEPDYESIALPRIIGLLFGL